MTRSQSDWKYLRAMERQRQAERDAQGARCTKCGEIIPHDETAYHVGEGAPMHARCRSEKP